MSTGTSQGTRLGKLPLPPLLPLPLAPLQQESCLLQGFRSLLLHLRLHLLALRRLLLRLLLLLLLPSGRQCGEEPERGGVNALSRRCCQQRRGHRRLPRSPVRQDCVQQLRLGILQDSRPRPRCILLLSPWGGVRVLSLHLSWLLHHRPRGLCTVVEGGRQFHSHRQAFMAAEGTELAVPATPGTPDAAIVASSHHLTSRYQKKKVTQKVDLNLVALVVVLQMT